MPEREKVIKGLECCIAEGSAPECEDCPYALPEDGTCERLDGMFKDALALLKAQEPVSPVFERQFMSSIELYNCGSCGTSLGAKGIAKYCMKCGQAVKWE